MYEFLYKSTILFELMRINYQSSIFVIS